MTVERRLALTLSGGGFRATLYHLGVIRFLYEAKLLPDVRRIVAVSGGSVLAAHLILNWDRYTHDQVSFDLAAREILDFASSDVRGRVVRRWLFAWLSVLPRLTRKKHWTFTNLLQGEYRRLFGSATLGDLNPAGGSRPHVFLNCTSLSTGSPCCFTRSGFTWYDESDLEHPITAPGIDLSLAVAASSAFPPLFPPIAVSHESLSCDLREFPHPHFLTDGGIFDNLGINRMLRYDKDRGDIDQIIISDAEGNFDWDFDNAYTLVTTRNIRASDLLMKRVSSLEYERAHDLKDRIVTFAIRTEIQGSGEFCVLSPEIQRSLRNVRTDLDTFSPHEISCLVQHGYTVAREISIDRGLAPATLPTFPWTSGGEGSGQPRRQLGQLKRSGHRRLGLWSSRDWVSWANAAALLVFGLILVAPTYLQHRELGILRQENAELQEASPRPQMIKSSGCVSDGRYPDPSCTPGAAALNISVDIVCHGSTVDRRTITPEVRKQVFEAYGIQYPPPAQAYELDHLVPLGLAGSTDVANLWPEPASPKPGFREKDKVELMLRNQVCRGELGLVDAQRIIATDWLRYYKEKVGK
ncbi:MAG TPA: patatin-like phospholipase family protein [Terracidiphilus sp.]|nr:patatin-like phospholipase family protein [Terracidiphilus sp.]